MPGNRLQCSIVVLSSEKYATSKLHGGEYSLPCSLFSGHDAQYGQESYLADLY